MSRKPRGPRTPPEEIKKEKKWPRATLQRLGINEIALLIAPDIETLVAMVTGGIEFAITSLRYSYDKDAIAFLDVWDAAKKWDKRMIPIQGWALVAEVDPLRFLGVIMMAVRDYSANRVKLLAMMNHPEIMLARIENAKRPDGVKDREAIDIMLGALPVNKGATFITNNFVNAGSELRMDQGQLPASTENEIIEAGDVDVDMLFPSLNDTQETIGRNGRQLSAAPEEESIEDLEAMING